MADDFSKKMITRLHRIEGQARGIEGMVREGKNFPLIVQQLEAIRAACSQIISMMIEERFCDPKRELSKEDLDYLRRFIKRS